MVVSASGALFGLTLDVEMQGCSDEETRFIVRLQVNANKNGKTKFLKHRSDI